MQRSAQPVAATILTKYSADLFQQQSTGNSAILGINAFGHDAAAVIVDSETGNVIYASTEERLTNVKHDWHFPIGSIHECCDEAIRLGKSITGVAVNFQSHQFVTRSLFSEIDRLCSTDLEGAERFKAALVQSLESRAYFSLRNVNSNTQLIDKQIRSLNVSKSNKATIAQRISWYYNWSVKYCLIEDRLKEYFQGVSLQFLDHHLAHAASAYFNSGFEDATVITLDGCGEASSGTVYHAVNGKLSLISQTNWPNSLGIFYLFATQHLGFGLGDEYKVMGMSAYGQPRFAPLLNDIVRVTEQASLEFKDTKYMELRSMTGIGHFAFQFTDRLNEVLPVRQKNDPFTQAHFDFAASIQLLTENTGVELARRAIALTGCPNIAIAGGVGLNGLMNEAIRKRSGCSDIFVYPAASDDGTAVGAAQWLVSQARSLPKNRLRSCYFGYEVKEDAIEVALKERSLSFSRPRSIHQQVAAALADGKIVARCHGRAEFGPRALGHRSILAHPGLKTMKETLNLRVKHREEFRPFAPACLSEYVNEYFELDCEAPFMLLITKAKEQARSKVPSVVHADGTARVQSISRQHNPDFYELVSAFQALTGLPMVLNTSFNVNGETIVNTPSDAIESFGFMDIDYLAIGPYWISKAENQSRFPELSHDDYLQIRRDRFAARNLGDLSKLDVGQFDSAFFEADYCAQHYMSDSPASLNLALPRAA
jgi:carbamoyltransferase